VRRALRPLSAALESLDSALAPATTLARVQKVWASAAGPAVAAAASPASERDGVLTVSCVAAVWAQELELMGAELVSRLNTALGSQVIRELRCRVA
jgi:predicted nucleic acid-binding Zn ribbon protein